MITSRQRIALQPAYVLHRYPYRNTSLLAEAFTLDHGRVGVVCRGARAPKSRYLGLIQPFRPLLLSWAGGGELYTLVAAEAAGGPPQLVGAIMVSAFYVNELLLRLVARGDPHPRLYRAYVETLDRLGAIPAGSGAEGDAASRIEEVLRLFETRLLAETGYALVLDRDVETGERVHAERAYRYLPELGPVALDRAGAEGISVSGSTLLALAGGALTERSSLREAKRLMRAVLGRYLGDRPLKSRALFTNSHLGRA